jgi:hypothetical protein
MEDGADIFVVHESSYRILRERRNSIKDECEKENYWHALHDRFSPAE